MKKNLAGLFFFLIIFVAFLPKAHSQCEPNTLTFNGSQPVYNTACGNTSYQTLNGSNLSGSGQTYRWEVSFAGTPYSTIVNNSNIPITSSDLSKSDITNFVLTPNGNASGDYRIRRIVTDASPACSSTSEPVFLYYSQSSASTSGGTVSGIATACSPASGSLTVSGHTGPVLQWESAPSAAGPWTPVSNTTNTLSYSNLTASTCYRALIDNICDGDAGDIDVMDKYSTTFCVTINSSPVVNAQPASQGICVGTSLTLSVTATSALPIIYQWRKGGANILGATSSSYTIANATGAHTGSYDVVVSNSCGSVTSNVALVTVNPTPTVSVPASVTVCPGETIAAANFTSTPSGATYTWTNSNTAIGLAASGNTTVPVFTATNSTTSPISATITVTPTLNGCVGTSSSYTITVKPMAIVTVPGSIKVCSGATVASSNFTSTPTGAIYAWTNSHPSIGLPANGTGNVPSFTATNTTSSPISASITVNPTVNNCEGTPATYTITVYPLPTISASALDASGCGIADGSITITTTTTGPLEYIISGSNGTFTRSDGNFSALIAGSYSTSIKNTVTNCIVTGPTVSISSPGVPVAPIINAFTNPVCEGSSLNLSIDNYDASLTYNWTGPLGFTETGHSITIPTVDPSMSGSYAVTANTASCVSPATIFSVSVNALPEAIVPANIVVCNGTTVPATNFTSTPNGAAYSWTSSNPDIGLPSGGTGNLPAFTAANNTSSRIFSTITVTPSLGGCTGPAATYTISVDPLPTATISGTPAICYGGTAALPVTLTGTAPWTITYSDGSNSVTETGITSAAHVINVNPSSTRIYTILSVSDNTSCSNSGNGTATVTVPAAPLSASFSSSNTGCFGSSTGSISYIISGGTAPYTINYSYNSGLSSGTFPVNVNSGTASGLPAGSYEITLTDANSCSPIVQTIVITQPTAALSGTTVSTNVSCFGAADGTITINPSGGYGTYQYSIDGGATWQPANTFTGLAPQTYNVKVRDASQPACLATINASLTISQPAAVSATVTLTDVTCFGLDNGTITVSASGGYGTYQYSLDGGINWQSDNTFTGLLPQTFSVKIRDALHPACTALIDNITIAQPAAAVTGIAASTNVTCLGLNNGTITITATGGYGTYEYSINGGISWQSGNIFTGLSSSSYHVLVRDASQSSCVVTINPSLTIMQPASAVFGMATSTNVTCFGLNNGTITINATGGYGNYEYTINGGMTWQPGNVFTGLAPGNYNVQVRDAAQISCLTVVNASLTIIQPAAALGGTIISTNISCFGANDGTITINATGGYGTYQYSINGGVNWQAGNRFNGLSPASYNVQIRDATRPACIAVINSSLIISQPADLTLTGSYSPILCYNGTTTVTLIPQGGTGSLEYRLGTGTFQSSNIFTGIPAGSHQFWVRDINGCEQDYTLTISQPTQLKLTATASTIQCDGTSTITLTAQGGTGNYQFKNGTGAYQVSNTFNLGQGSYTFYVTDGACEESVPVTVAGQSTLNLTGNFTSIACLGGNSTVTLAASGGNGSYTYKADDGTWQNGNTFTVPSGDHIFTVRDAGGCLQFYQVNIPETNKLNVVLTKLKDASCFGTSTGSLNLNITGSKGTLSINWFKDGLPISAPTDLNALPAGTYSVQVTDACTSINSNEIIIQPSPLSVILRKIKDADCTGTATGVLDLQISGGEGTISQVWTKNGIAIPTPANLSAFSAGAYRVTVKDNCSTIQSNNIIIDPAALQVDFYKINDVSCNGNADGGIGLRIFNTTGATTVSWLKDNVAISTPPDLRKLGAGTYHVKVADFCSQVITEKVIISEPGILNTTIHNKKDVSCYAGANGNVELVTNGGTAPYRYLWSNGSTSKDLANVVAGTYTITITDANNCSATNSVTINQPVRPLSIVFTKKDVSCFGSNNGSINLVVAGGTAPYTYKWSTGQITKDISSLTAADYVVTVTDSKGCIAIEAITVNQPSALALTHIKTEVSCFGEKNGSINITVTGGTAPYSYRWSDGQTIEDRSNLSPYLYSITVLDANGCTVSQEIEITQPVAALKASLTVTHTVCKISNDGAITAAATGGTQPYTYAWKGLTQTSDVISNLAPGIYELLVTDANGCTFTTSAEVLAGNCPPIAVDDKFTTDEEVAITGSVALNDFDRQNESVIFTITSLVKNGTISFSDDGGFTYTPNKGFWGTEIFTYKICNTSGLCADATASIDVIPYTVVSLTPSILNVREGKKAVITATLMRPFKDDVTITISYAGNAGKDKDYVLLNQFQSIRIPKGATTTTEKITVAALTDDLQEDDEDVILRISETSDPLVRIGTGSVVIISDIYPSDSFPGTPVSKDEIPPNPDIAPDPLISPNYDGQGNEFFKIDNIISFPDNEVVIFNRWGNEVFRLRGYNESDRVFSGVANKGLATNTSSPLPDGVYYYLITTRRSVNGNHVEALNKGYLILKR